MASFSPGESFRELLQRYRGLTGLTLDQLAVRSGMSRRTVQDWESGRTYPSAERLQALIAVLLAAGGLSGGGVAEEAEALWAAVEREAPRMRSSFDRAWFARLLAGRVERPPERPAAECREDWGEAPDTVGFVGRAEELRTLRSWVLDERCRLLAVLGMGGIGKTIFTARLARVVAPSFERVYWRSLRDAPPISNSLAGAIGFLSDQQLVPPADASEQLATFLQLLRQRRCLMVLDNFETLLEPGQGGEVYQPGLDGYGRLLLATGEASHQSCLVLTSREAPEERAVFHGGGGRIFHLSGLSVNEAQMLLASKQLVGTSTQWAELVARFGGNGLALKLVGETVHERFGGDIRPFLENAGAGGMFESMRRLLAEQVERGSALEQQVLRVLAVEREPVSLARLLAALGSRVGHGAVLEAVEALWRRSLVDRAETPGPAAFTLQSVVLEYMTERLVEAVANEIERGQPALLIKQPLIQAQAKEYVRQSQQRLIGMAILHQLSAQDGDERTQQRLEALLDSWRGRSPGEQGYGPGNVVNLLRLLRGELRGLDLSRLTLRQAYLAEVEAQNTTLAASHLVETVLAGAFDFPTSVALSGDGTLLVAGTSTGDVGLWRVADRTPLWAVQAHTGTAWSVALSADGHLLASGGGDGTMRLWETSTGRPLASLQGHSGGVPDVTISANGQVVATGGNDGTVRLWDAGSGRLRATLRGHTGTAWSVALSADGHLLASGGGDGTMRLWETSTGRPLTTLQGHTGAVYGVALSADSLLLASGGADGTARLWETTTGRALVTVQSHTGMVCHVALSADGQLLAGGGGDGTVGLWETSTGRPLDTLHGHTGLGPWGGAVGRRAVAGQRRGRRIGAAVGRPKRRLSACVAA